MIVCHEVFEDSGGVEMSDFSGNAHMLSCLLYGMKYRNNVVESTALQTGVGLQLVVSP